MDTRTERRPRGAWPVVATLIAVVLPAAACRGETAAWDEPAIDTWSYVNGFGGGSRLLTPSFGGIGIDEETNEFLENGASGPARLGSMLLAFETDDLIEVELDAGRYAIESVTVTARLQSGSTASVPYEDQPITTAGLLDEALNGGITWGQPMELFGVGFREGYEGFALGPDQTGQRFAESTPVYSGAGASYVAYPVVGGGGSVYADVSNSLTGGFSATTPDETTTPFDATPWALGEAPLTPGAAVPNDTTFSFDIDLAQPGVVDYLQRSLAEGAVGFFLSSVHPASQPGSPSGDAYPQWYAKEAIGIYAGAEAATLSIDYTILPIPGDYDADGAVDSADYDAWTAAYGSTVATPGLGADGNADGVVDAADYALWRDAHDAVEAIAVPEPTAGVYALAGVATVSFCVGTCFFSSPRGPRE
ncbi:hypothetical protein MalM25_32270 [Planctomycetes bacterium MalM25]|nr:hypothetical protein MalM25_32270 [Planctomycetes bacterium MalM25]